MIRQVKDICTLRGRTFAAIAASVLCLGFGGVCHAVQQESMLSTGPVIVAPAGLTDRERHEADREYAYQYRSKYRLLSPGVSSSRGVSGGQVVETEPVTEEEKLYRYFGAATKFYEDGHYEEAIEILEYILSKDPRNKYIRDYLKKVVKVNARQEKQWKEQSRKQAAVLTRQRVSRALTEGEENFKHKRYDAALVNFRDVLEIDPDNPKAKRYMAELEDHYGRETRVERILRGPENPEEGYSEELLDEAELALVVKEIIVRQKEEAAKVDVLTFVEGDVLRVSVYNHPELSGDVSVQADGNIFLPLVDMPVRAKGLSVEEVAGEIKREIANYVRDPNISVSLISTSRLFYFIDEVGCTPYPITHANFTLRDALFLSDWGNNRALGRVIVITPHEVSPIVRKVDAFDLIYRGNLSSNVMINDGDIIYVPMTIVGKTTQTISDTIAPFRAIRSARDEWLDLKWDQKGYKSMFRIYENRQLLPQSVNEGN
jgi:polysaccharide biosynthesis/export protein